MTFPHKNKPIAEPRGLAGAAHSPKSPAKNRRGEPRATCIQQALCIWIDRDHKRQAHSIEVFNQSAGGLGFHTPLPLEAGQTIWLQSGATACVEGVVCFCEPDGEGYRAGLLCVERERRRLNRRPVSTSGALSWPERPHCGITLPVTIRNMTPDGLRLEACSAVPVPLFVRMAGNEFECQSTTRYCRQAEGRYLIGIEFLDAADDGNAIDPSAACGRNQIGRRPSRSCHCELSQRR